MGRVADVYHLQPRIHIRHVGVVAGHRHAVGVAWCVITADPIETASSSARQRAGKLKGVQVSQPRPVPAESPAELAREGIGRIGQGGDAVKAVVAGEDLIRVAQCDIAGEPRVGHRAGREIPRVEID